MPITKRAKITIMDAWMMFIFLVFLGLFLILFFVSILARLLFLSGNKTLSNYAINVLIIGSPLIRIAVLRFKPVEQIADLVGVESKEEHRLGYLLLGVGCFHFIFRLDDPTIPVFQGGQSRDHRQIQTF